MPLLRRWYVSYSASTWPSCSPSRSQLQVNVVRVVAHGVPVMLGLALIVIGNLLPRLRPNLVIGIRTSRTLADRAMGANEPDRGYAAVGAGASFLLAGLLPSLP